MLSNNGTRTTETTERKGDTLTHILVQTQMVHSQVIVDHEVRGQMFGSFQSLQLTKFAKNPCGKNYQLLFPSTFWLPWANIFVTFFQPKIASHFL